MTHKKGNRDTGKKETIGQTYRLRFREAHVDKQSHKRESDATAIVKASEKSLIKKNEFEYIHKVFSIKDLNNKFRRILGAVGSKSKLKLTRPRNWFLINRLSGFQLKVAAISVLILVNVLFFLSSVSISYKVYMAGHLLGVVNHKDEMARLLDEAGSQISAAQNREVSFESKLDFKPFVTWKSQKVDSNQIIENIKSKGLFKNKGYSICVNGNEIVVVPTRLMAESLLEKIKEPFKTAPETNVEFVESVEIKDKTLEDPVAITFDDALKALSKSKDESKIYKVQKGDTLWLIARKNDMTIDQITGLNPGITETIREGQEIKLNNPVPLITVRTRDVTILKEQVPFDVIEQKDNSKYTNQRSIISRGRQGLKEARVEVVKENGMEVARNYLSETILVQPVAQREKVGAKALPPKWGTGTFDRPMVGMVTSRFGPRWGRMHEGIDIEGNVGDPIYAADGGRIIFAGYEGGYGKLIKIHHDNNFVSYYGHCSKILVSEGSRVYKGQKIGLVGMTGRTTGPHLHFEIRKNGSPQNPVKYLR